MSVDNGRTNRDKVVPLPLKDVTAACVSGPKSVPYARSMDGFRVSSQLVADTLTPQQDESMFLKLYVADPLLKTDGKLNITSTDIFRTIREESSKSSMKE